MLIGPGYFLSENTSTQANDKVANVFRLIVGEGADGSVITGLYFSSFLTIQNITRSGSTGTNPPGNITVTRNWIIRLNISNDITNGVLATQNYISERLDLDRRIENVTITNNIFIDKEVS